MPDDWGKIEDEAAEARAHVQSFAKEIDDIFFPRRREAYCTVCEKFFTGDLVDHRRSATHKV